MNYNCNVALLKETVNEIMKERKANANEHGWYSSNLLLKIEGRILRVVYYIDHLSPCGGNSTDIIEVEGVKKVLVEGHFSSDGYHKDTQKVYKFPELWEDRYFYETILDNQNGKTLEWGFTFPMTKEDDYILLSEGNYLMNRFGKYKPNLAILNDAPIIFWEHCESRRFNLPKEASLSYIVGDFFVSKKGTKCFRITEKGKHILIKDKWGGCFCKYYGGSLPEKGSVYYHRASSNGGGMGTDYAVFPRDWKYSLSENEI